MKKFLIRIILILAGAVFMFLAFNIVCYKYMGDSVIVAFEVYDAIDEAGNNEGYTRLVLGDSVARQIFSPKYQAESNETCYLATNQAIMTAGNYILLERFIENNPQLEEVYYIARPDSLLGGIGFKYTYSYFVTPLYKEPYIQYLEADTREQIEGTFGTFCAKDEFPKWLMAKYPKLLSIYQNSCEKIYLQKFGNDGKETDSAVLYIQKMKTVCDENNIKFHMLASPVPENYQYDARQMRERLAFYDMEEMIDEYEDSIIYIDADKFRDGIHMEHAFIDEVRVEMRERFLAD